MQLNYFQSFVITDSSVGVFPDYVCVLDLGMFELSLFTSDGSEQVRTPKQKSIKVFFFCYVISCSIEERVNSENLLVFMKKERQ